MTDKAPVEPETIATPEGDNETLPDEPLMGDEPGIENGLERPRGDQPHSEEPLYPAS